MQDITKILGLVAGSIGTVAALYTAVTFTHDKIQKVDELEQRIERSNDDIKQVRGNVIIDEIKTEIRTLQLRIFRIEERYGEDVYESPGLIREEYKQDKIDLDILQQELKATQRAYKALR
jgi:TolA-binding protein